MSKNTNTPEVKAPEFKACACGCKENVPSKRTFRPGHDARHAGNVGRALAVKPNDAKVKAALAELSAPLQAKAHRVAATAKAKADAKIEREAAKAAKAA